MEIYNLPVVVIPTNNPMIRKDFNDQMLNRKEKISNYKKDKRMQSKRAAIINFHIEYK